MYLRRTTRGTVPAVVLCTGLGWFAFQSLAGVEPSAPAVKADVSGPGDPGDTRPTIRRTWDSAPSLPTRVRSPKLDTELVSNSMSAYWQFRQCRERKENLSFRSEALFSSILPDGRPFQYKLDRKTLEMLIADIIAETVALTEQMRQDAQHEGHTIDTVVLIGGSSRVPLVVRMLQEKLPVRPQKWQHQDVAVALGAAYHGQALWGGSQPSATTTAKEDMTLPPATMVGHGQYAIGDSSSPATLAKDQAKESSFQSVGKGATQRGFCPNCGSYDAWDGTHCEQCSTRIPVIEHDKVGEEPQDVASIKNLLNTPWGVGPPSGSKSPAPSTSQPLRPKQPISKRDSEWKEGLLGLLGPAWPMHQSGGRGSCRAATAGSAGVSPSRHGTLTMLDAVTGSDKTPKTWRSVQVHRGFVRACKAFGGGPGN